MHKRNGFGIIESMLVLALFATIILSIIIFNSRNAANKDAKILSAQTEAFATAYAKYMKTKDGYEFLVKQTQTGSVTLSPTSLGTNWPIDLSKANMYRQIPCVTVVKNPDTGALEALMYYVGGTSFQPKFAVNIVRSASIELGSKGGILLNGAVQGNSGWQVNASSSFLTGASICGGALANDSLAVNLDLLPDWNQNLQPLDSLLRGPDQESLPGQFNNSNTLKSNLYFSPGSGIILDNANPNNQVKLSILYNGSGSGAPTLGLGSSTSTKIISDTLQPNLSFKAGDSCTPDEEGKTVADQGYSDGLNLFISRSTLVCTKSDLLCGSGNYCYLTSVPNSITFQNITRGIQNEGGQFICPRQVPFAVAVKTGFLGGGNVYAFVDNGFTSPNTIDAKLNKAITFPWKLNCPKSGCNPGIRTDYRSLIIDGVGQLVEVDLATIKGDPVGTSGTGGDPSYTVISGQIKDYSTPIGYKVDINPSPVACDQVCENLSIAPGYSWQLLGTQRKFRVWNGVTIDNQDLGCACERKDFSGSNHDNYNGIAVVKGAGKPIIVSATCSNMPLYYKN